MVREMIICLEELSISFFGDGIYLLEPRSQTLHLLLTRLFDKNSVRQTPLAML